jgi:protein-S-isoprenylcysteine O-methyltransferase Ste14
MTVVLNPLPTAVFCAVLGSWLVFALLFLSRKRPPKAPERKRDQASRWGIVLQGVGYALVWSVRRQYFTPLVPMPKSLETALAILTMAMAVGSVWICFAGVRTLDKQWAFVARVVEGHKLITEGPYHWVRNPIYLGMFGMLLATGLAISRWWIIPVAAVLFLMGNTIRVRSEEKLLRESFGAEFEVYAQRVPAMFPRLF